MSSIVLLSYLIMRLILPSLLTFLSVAAVAVAGAGTGTGVPSSTLVLNTSLGSIQGSYVAANGSATTNASSIIQYTNIPYADVTSYTGANRWKVPTMITSF